MAPLIITKSILINAPAFKVWRVLTKPEFTKEYMFGSEVHSDWLEGSAVEWKGADGLIDSMYVKGKVLKVDPEKHVEYSTFDTQGGLPDIPANYLKVTYNLQPKKTQTLLTVIQGNFAEVAEGPDRFDEAVEGWEATLPEIKRIAELDEEC